ncbi:MAG: carboxypeptidase-like regulatory domain-containing protein [Methanocella sp.]
MDGDTRWAVSLIVAMALTMIFLVSFTGSAEAARVYGTVTDSKGVAVTGATVTLYQNGNEYLLLNNPMTTMVTGYYEFDNLPVGPYSVQADKGGFSSNSVSVNIADSDVQADLSIPGFDSRAVKPTVFVTPTPTPTPTPKPTLKVSNTPVPLPTVQPSPGFELLLAVISIGLLAAVKGSRRR